MEKSSKTLVVIATYNEIENLPELVEAIFRYLPQADLLVIDDNSPDGTGQWCDEYSRRDPRLHCLHRPGKLGLGSAILDGMRFGLERDYARLMTMDADFSHHPRYLPQLEECLENNEGVGVVIGSRYVAGGQTQGWPRHRRLMSRAVNAYARSLLGLRARDCSGGLRLYRREALRRLDLRAMASVGYSFQEEMLWRLQRNGVRFAEVPILFVDREKGRTKISWRDAAEAARVILQLAIQQRLHRPPRPPDSR